MRQAPRSESLYINGSAGRLECLLETPAIVSPLGAAVICHPHPVHGGTMQNKVAHTLSRAFVAQDFGALRFNFRGVGKSEGEFDDGTGELKDVLSALDFTRERFPELPVWLAGFSFGAAMAVCAAAEEKVAGLISIAPAAFRFVDNKPAQPVCPWLIVHGENDELADVDATIEWVNSMEPGPELCLFPDTTHFFHGKLIKLREVVVNFVAQHAPTPGSGDNPQA